MTIKEFEEAIKRKPLVFYNYKKNILVECYTSFLYENGECLSTPYDVKDFKYLIFLGEL